MRHKKVSVINIVFGAYLVFFLASDTKCSHALISMEDSE